MFSRPKAIVIDTGSGMCRGGFAGNSLPSVLIASIVGRPFKDKEPAEGINPSDVFVGNIIEGKEKKIELLYPVNYGMIDNWDDVAALWSYTFEKLKVKPEEHPVLLTEAPLNPGDSREKMVESMFEVFHTPAMSLANQAELALYACGRTSGTVLKMGETVCHAVPILEGRALPFVTNSPRLAGQHLTAHLMKSLDESGLDVNCVRDRAIARKMKETLCYVSTDLRHEMTLDIAEVQRPYTLPDGRVINVGRERFLCCEALFKPSEMGPEFSDAVGIHTATADAIMKCDEDIRTTTCSEILLTGGTSMLKDVETRFTEEVSLLLPRSMFVKIITQVSRQYSTFLGGSIMASQSSFKGWITKKEYDEFGSAIVHRKLPYYTEDVMGK